MFFGSLAITGNSFQMNRLRLGKGVKSLFVWTEYRIRRWTNTARHMSW